MTRLQRVKQILEECAECHLDLDIDKKVAEIDELYSEEYSPSSEHFKHILGMGKVLNMRGEIIEGGK